MSPCTFHEEKLRNILRPPISVAATNHHELVFPCVQDECWDTETIHGDNLDVINDEESHHENLDEGDHVHENHDDVMFSLFHSTTSSHSMRCAVFLKKCRVL